MSHERFRHMQSGQGFTLIEVIIVVIIAGILATVALRSVSLIGDTARTEETKQELDNLAEAMVGRSTLHSGGVRSDFGYVGDIGALPPDLDALLSNPGGYATWNGPYVSNRFAQTAADFKTDAWGELYSYGGVDITSTGSGQPIVRKLAGSTSELLYNQVGGNVYDADGTPPGTDYADSIEVRLVVPNGVGGIATRLGAADPGGYFVFDSIPIGNHVLDIVYRPTSDTLHRFVSVLPNSAVYQEYFLDGDLWSGGGAGPGGGNDIEFVDGSDSLVSSHCNVLSFWITNSTGSPMTITSLKLTWSSPTAYYTPIDWNGTNVYSGPINGSGATAIFSSPQSLAAGASAQIQIGDFRANSGGGGAQVDMSGATFTVELSDGSVFTVSPGGCYW